MHGLPTRLELASLGDVDEIRCSVFRIRRLQRRQKHCWMEKAFVGWELGLISAQDPRVPQQPLLAAAETAARGAATRGGEAAAAAPRGEAEPRSAGAQRPASSPPARATSPERWGPRRGRRAAALRRAWPFREIACPRPRKRAHNRGNTRILSPRMGFEARLPSVARSAQYRQRTSPPTQSLTQILKSQCRIFKNKQNSVVYLLYKATKY